MMTLCLRYTKSEEDAMEALNSGFYKVFTQMAKYDPAKGALYTWISTIIIRSCISLLRKKGIEQVTNYGLPDNYNPFIEPEVISQARTGDLLKMLLKLPSIQQTVFNLFVCDGYSHKEIGQLLGINENTSKWHLSNARKKMQELIRESQIHG
jgi:RNA polymerase sigma-70 factor (ECF subfamily)